MPSRVWWNGRKGSGVIAKRFYWNDRGDPGPAGMPGGLDGMTYVEGPDGISEDILLE